MTQLRLFIEHCAGKGSTHGHNSRERVVVEGVHYAVMYRHRRSLANGGADNLVGEAVLTRIPAAGFDKVNEQIISSLVERREMLLDDSFCQRKILLTYMRHLNIAHTAE